MLLFLGSGISVPSGLPGIVDLTRAVLGAHSSTVASGGSLQADNELHPPASNHNSAASHALLKLLFDLDAESRASIACYPSGKGFKYSGAIYRKQTTYEDLFYLCEQIRWSGEALVDDVPIALLVDEVEKRAGGILPAASREARLFALYRLAKEASKLIERTIESSLLCFEPIGLDAISQLATEESLDIVTLNHDTLVEQALWSAGIIFYDGFGPTDGDVRWSHSKFTSPPSTRVRIVKPHGSIDWKRFLVSGSAKVGKVAPGMKSGWRDSSMNEIPLYSSAPSFLTGNNKIASYNSGIYAEMMHAFHQALRDNDTMVMSGYGWGDLGINLRIETWLDQSTERRLILLHEKPSELIDRSLQIDQSHRYWIESGKLIMIEKWLCNVSPEELLKAINSTSTKE